MTQTDPHDIYNQFCVLFQVTLEFTPLDLISNESVHLMIWCLKDIAWTNDGPVLNNR